MKHTRLSLSLKVTLLLPLICPYSIQASATDATARPHYKVAQVLPLTVAPGITISDDYLRGTTEQIVASLENTRHFEEVSQSATAAPAASTVKVTGTVTKYVPGSRAERLIIGMGAGTTKITVHLVFTDAETGKVIVEGDARGVVWYGPPIRGGASSSNAQKGVGKDVAKLVDQAFADKAP